MKNAQKDKGKEVNPEEGMPLEERVREAVAYRRQWEEMGPEEQEKLQAEWDKNCEEMAPEERERVHKASADLWKELLPEGREIGQKARANKEQAWLQADRSAEMEKDIKGKKKVESSEEGEDEEDELGEEEDEEEDDDDEEETPCVGLEMALESEEKPLRESVRQRMEWNRYWRETPPQERKWGTKVWEKRCEEMPPEHRGRVETSWKEAIDKRKTAAENFLRKQQTAERVLHRLGDMPGWDAVVERETKKLLDGLERHSASETKTEGGGEGPPPPPMEG